MIGRRIKIDNVENLVDEKRIARQLEHPERCVHGRISVHPPSSNWTSFSSPWARAWDGDEVVDLAVGRLALHPEKCFDPEGVMIALSGAEPF